MIWRNGCCIKKRISGILCPHCSKCECKKCTDCGQKQTCEKCPGKETSKECKCAPCKKYKCDLKEAFEEAQLMTEKNNIDEPVKVVKVEGDNNKPEVVVTTPTATTPTATKTLHDSVAKPIKPTVVVKVPPPPKCKCPSCSNQIYGSDPYTYYPIYQPRPYGFTY
jgi:hypothetical protein